MVAFLDKNRFRLMALVVFGGLIALLSDIALHLGQGFTYVLVLYLLGAAYYGHKQGSKKAVKGPSKESLKELDKKRKQLQQELMDEKLNAEALTSQMNPAQLTEV
jgi:uncharacterized membrane protein YqjE